MEHRSTPRFAKTIKSSTFPATTRREFLYNIRRRIGGKTIDIHTGGIGLWRLMKEGVPHALSSKKTAAIMRCVRQWPWRWNCGNNNLAFKLDTQLNQR